MPSSGLNWDYIAHYGSDHRQYERIEPLVDGKREGESILLNYDLPIPECSYTNEVVTYDVEEVTPDVVVLDSWERLLSILPQTIDSSAILNAEDSLLSYDIESESIHGVLKSSEKYFVIDASPSTSRVVMADMNSKEMVVYINDERSDIPYTKEVIDLDTNGKRWEGSARNGKPFGYGVVYNEEGGKEYEGFMFDGVRTCYGTEYYNDIEEVEYEGSYYNSVRFGKGALYDRKGTIECEGIWKNDIPYSSSFDGKTIDSHTESIDIPSNSFNESRSFILPSFVHSLKRIVIGDDCFGSVRSFKLDGLNELESIVIGQKCFTYIKEYETINYSKRMDGVCRIVNCPKLKSIRIGGYSFSDYRSFESSNLPSLQSIDTDGWCFYWTLSFSLTGLTGWVA